MRKLLLAGFCLIAVGVAMGQTPMQVLHTIASPFENAPNSWGGIVNGNSDINGDGYDDIIISGHPIGSALGRRDVYIYLGGSILSSTPDYIIADPAIPGPHYLFGSSIAYNGDLNGDGYSDLVISEPGHYGADGTGRVHIYYGGPDFDTTADVILYGIEYGFDPWGLNFGSNLDISGDFNGDGYKDLVIYSAHRNLYHYGEVDIFYGGPGFDLICDWSYHGEMVEEFGSSLSIGDINGDGFSDLATWSSYFGAMDHHQELKIFLGAANFDNIADATYLFNQEDSMASVMMGGDLNQDGFDDLVLRAYPNLILWGNADLSGGFCALNLPVAGSDPAYYAVKENATFIVNMKGSASPRYVEYYLSSCTAEDLLVNYYEHIYYPDSISGCRYGYFLGDVNSDGNIDLLVTTSIENNVVFQIITTSLIPDSIDDNTLSPIQNLLVYPNPMKDQLSIKLTQDDGAAHGKNRIDIYNIRGQKVRSIPICKAATPSAQIVWDRLDNEGRRCPTGIYLLRDISNPQITKKITLIK